MRNGVTFTNSESLLASPGNVLQRDRVRDLHDTAGGGIANGSHERVLRSLHETVNSVTCKSAE